jgi:hypothetical protein
MDHSSFEYFELEHPNEYLAKDDEEGKDQFFYPSKVRCRGR